MVAGTVRQSGVIVASRAGYFRSLSGWFDGHYEVPNTLQLSYFQSKDAKRELVRFKRESGFDPGRGALTTAHEIKSSPASDQPARSWRVAGYEAPGSRPRFVRCKKFADRL
jgi:hypothetical protein